MGKVKELNIRNRTYYYFNDIINIKDFHSKLTNSIKTLAFTILVTLLLKKIGDCENIISVNPLYLMIDSATGYFKEKCGEKHLIINSTEKYDEVFSGVKKEIETINGGKELFHEKKNYARIRINTDDDVPLNKPLKFPTLTIIIRCIFQEREKLYPQIYLDACLYKNVRV